MQPQSRTYRWQAFASDSVFGLFLRRWATDTPALMTYTGNAATLGSQLPAIPGATGLLLARDLPFMLLLKVRHGVRLIQALRTPGSLQDDVSGRPQVTPRRGRRPASCNMVAISAAVVCYSPQAVAHLCLASSMTLPDHITLYLIRSISRMPSSSQYSSINTVGKNHD